MEAFVKVSIYKLFGYLCFCIIIMFVSICTKKTVLTLFLSTITILVPYFGLTARWIQYLLPLPLGFMIGNGFFRGDEMIDSTDRMDSKIIFRSIPDWEFTTITVVLITITLILILLMTKKYTNRQFIKREAGEKP